MQHKTTKKAAIFKLLSDPQQKNTERVPSLPVFFLSLHKRYHRLSVLIACGNILFN